MGDPNKYERALISDALEHDDTGGPKVKRVGNYIWNTDTLQWEKDTGTIHTGDIEIGAVEIKDGTTDTRAIVFNPTSINIATAGAVKTITETDGARTKTTTIDATDPLDKDITVVWS